MKSELPAPAEPIRSASNPLIKDIRKAVARGRLTSLGLWVAEGPRLLEEALSSGVSIETVLVTEAKLPRVRGRVPSWRVVESRVFDEISATETTQGVMALVRPPEWSLEAVFNAGGPLVALSALQDPGNAGAIVRSAEAFGAGGVLFLEGTASPHHPKTLRASAGSLFRLPFLAGWTAAALLEEVKRRRMSLRAADPRGNVRLDQVDWRGPTLLAIGSEAHGVEAALLEHCQRVRIPTSKVESLNAGAAAAVMLYEAARQRSAAKL